MTYEILLCLSKVDFFFPLPNQIRIWIQVAATKMFVTICICYTSLFRSVQVIIAVSSLVLIALFEKLFQAGACVSSRGWTSGADRFAEKLFISGVVVLQEPVLCCRLLGHHHLHLWTAYLVEGKPAKELGFPGNVGWWQLLDVTVCAVCGWVSVLCILPFPLSRTEQILAAEGEGKALFLHSILLTLRSSGFIGVCFGTFFTFGLIYFNSSWGEKWREDLHPKSPSLYCLIDWLAYFFKCTLFRNLLGLKRNYPLKGESTSKHSLSLFSWDFWYSL